MTLVCEGPATGRPVAEGTWGLSHARSTALEVASSAAGTLHHRNQVHLQQEQHAGLHQWRCVVASATMAGQHHTVSKQQQEEEEKQLFEQPGSS